MMKIGITGQTGFLGTHLSNNLRLEPEKYEIIPFERSFFDQDGLLDEFVASCDIIYHLAAINRHDDPQIIYETNITLSKKLVESLERSKVKPHIIFSSSLQESSDNKYGDSKKIARELLHQWAAGSGASFTGFIIPNVYGPFGKPFYNSFVATFCHLLNNGGYPEIKVDNEVPLIYVQNLVLKMLEAIHIKAPRQVTVEIPEDGTYKVTEILELFHRFQQNYTSSGIMPSLDSDFQRNMFNTFRSYINHKDHFPVRYVQHSDERGTFVEIIRLEQHGQVSFSTTVPGVTRGNHFHTRKIERFSVIKGKALIELRRVDSDEVLSFKLDGQNPSYVDMPIWYTHNIKNVGEEELYTMFWINEFYNPQDPDTYFVTV
ncbi:epimerase [Nonlabens sp. YIK11]|uniref:polysaccharide biosynthesis C-terminal domain-containing protein n=1 Tax=Nonlabens sp. YIK11 TaxID=1453349 RepID=UPI0006DC561C|nr:NAD-dependent epimerase/dehydratase family protein [Nonlabens sp. YIK11]KQC34063.1 epimerase [Nonlabens sp. YIK11]